MHKLSITVENDLSPSKVFGKQRKDKRQNIPDDFFILFLLKGTTYVLCVKKFEKNFRGIFKRAIIKFSLFAG